MVLSMPPTTGKSRARLSGVTSVPFSTTMPAFLNMAASSRKVTTASTVPLYASSFLDRQGPMNTVCAFGKRSLMS